MTSVFQLWHNWNNCRMTAIHNVWIRSPMELFLVNFPRMKLWCCFMSSHFITSVVIPHENLWEKVLHGKKHKHKHHGKGVSWYTHNGRANFSILAIVSIWMLSRLHKANDSKRWRQCYSKLTIVCCTINTHCVWQMIKTFMSCGDAVHNDWQSSQRIVNGEK